MRSNEQARPAVAETISTPALTFTELARIEHDLDDLVMPDYETVRRLIRALRSAHARVGQLTEERAVQGCALVEIASVVERAGKRVA